jgi:dTDP-4-dehydrorhamnose 3,5-epimerase
VVAGSVYDVVLDIRKNSPTYCQWHGEVLSADNMTRLWIPEGFAHGFLTLEDDSLFQYKCSAYFHKESEGCIAYDDAMLAVDWKGAWDRHGSGDFTPLVSEKDKDGSAFASFQSPFHS